VQGIAFAANGVSGVYVTTFQPTSLESFRIMYKKKAPCLPPGVMMSQSEMTDLWTVPV
jgi:hypothetical protein